MNLLHCALTLLKRLPLYACLRFILFFFALPLSVEAQSSSPNPESVCFATSEQAKQQRYLFARAYGSFLKRNKVKQTTEDKSYYSELNLQSFIRKKNHFFRTDAFNWLSYAEVLFISEPVVLSLNLYCFRSNQAVQKFERILEEHDGDIKFTKAPLYFYSYHKYQNCIFYIGGADRPGRKPYIAELIKEIQILFPQ